MKGIILAAGKGTRMYPVTLPICKPLLPVYDKPMIYYPLSVLIKAKIRDILVIVPPNDFGPFQSLLGDGSRLGINISYIDQKEPRGIADSFIIAEDFIGDDSVCLALGDNIFYGPAFTKKLKTALSMAEESGAAIFGYYVADPHPFGVVEFGIDGKAISIEEKPISPKSNYIVPGLYFYNNEVVDIAKHIVPSARGELEITSVNNEFLKRGQLSVVKLDEEYSWFDAGTARSLYQAAGHIQEAQRSGKLIGCPERAALKNHWINEDDIMKVAMSMSKSQYGEYLSALAEGMD